MLNASNAKFISDAMLSISRKISDEIFFKSYIEFIRHGQFQKLGAAVTEEILRLLIQYVSDPNLIKTVIESLWDRYPHQDVRTCLDDYLPVVRALFAADRGDSRWLLTELKNSSNNLFEIFVNQIQFKILDHQTSLEACSYAWLNLEYNYCHTTALTEKARNLCIQFDKNANILWEKAFATMVSFYKQQKIS
ncbi:unnamed protein product [Rotaria sp. Silwood2]|nr:unnamed protein product [Rotaria sp. Silwood2]